mgnify:CR=1 FL=1
MTHTAADTAPEHKSLFRRFMYSAEKNISEAVPMHINSKKCAHFLMFFPALPSISGKKPRTDLKRSRKPSLSFCDSSAGWEENAKIAAMTDSSRKRRRASLSLCFKSHAPSLCRSNMPQPAKNTKARTIPPLHKTAMFHMF